VSETGLGQTRQVTTTSEYGILGIRDVDFHLDRVPASADLADLVERHWLVRWHLPEGRRASVTLLPHPCVNLVFDRGQVAIAGVGQERFTYEYSGEGRVFGVKFRPGAFLPFLGGPVSQLTGQAVPLATLWGADDARRFAGELATSADLDDLVAVAERHLRAHWPQPDLEVAIVGRIVHALLHDRSVSRVDDVSARFGLSARSLQRLFQRYVGVSPKWVLQRYRLHEAAARLAEGTGGTWAEVAVELGYFDQSHFIRDFTRAVGMTPVAYADACARGQAPVSA
jgi:AraC-like DNA-binding protein